MYRERILTDLSVFFSLSEAVLGGFVFRDLRDTCLDRSLPASCLCCLVGTTEPLTLQRR